MNGYKIEKLDNFGRGICYVNNKITFVKNALPDEIVEIEITKINKKYNEGVVSNYIKKSPSRINVKCPYYEKCDGCNLMHLSYENTVKYKKEKIESILEKYANEKIDIELVSSPHNINYRNKITLKINNGNVGYYKEKSHRFIEINNCLLVDKKINDIFELIKTFNIHDGEVTIRINCADKLLIDLKTNNKIKIEDKYDKNIVGIILNDKVVYGVDYLIDKVNDVNFKVSYNSFFQINPYITSIIFKDFKEYIKGSIKVLDLYCGVGTLGLNIAKEVKELYGVEVIPNAIVDAKENAKLNKLTNTNYYLGEVEKVIKKLPKKIDTVIVDPPRSGLDSVTKKELLKMLPQKIIYMSCDIMTLARDISVLKDKYEIQNIKAYDMFPYTYHVETICIMKKL